mmetsp:Transcript_47606/g.103761  ORF Transcript_47606/g.103761 Transcript_47606/m.103761 type:complete len:224 (-) Transcript_47606:217-888(-)
MLLHCHIGQVDHGIRQICQVHGEAGMGEAGKSTAIQVDCQRAVARDQNIESQIKLLPTNQQRIRQVPLNHIRLSFLLFFLIFVAVFFVSGFLLSLLLQAHPLWVLAPARHLAQPVEEENSTPLRLSHGLHDPNCAIGLLLLELFDKHRILQGQNKGCWGASSESLCLFHQTILQSLAMSTANVLHQQILPGQLIVVAKVIHSLMSLKVNVIKSFVNPFFVAPE